MVHQACISPYHDSIQVQQASRRMLQVMSSERASLYSKTASPKTRPHIDVIREQKELEGIGVDIYSDTKHKLLPQSIFFE